MNEDIHLKILKYANTKTSFSVSEIRSDLNLKDAEVQFLQKQLDGASAFFIFVGTSGADSAHRYALTFEGKSRLLEYDEFALARKNSQEAKILAIIAIIISVTTVVIQLCTIQDVRIIDDAPTKDLKDSL